MRQGTLFTQNKEPVSVRFYNIFAYRQEYIAQDVDAVFHPIASGLIYNDGVLSQTQADADWRVVLGEANALIEETYTLVREADGIEYEIVDVLAFAGAMHLFVSQEGI